MCLGPLVSQLAGGDVSLGFIGMIPVFLVFASIDFITLLFYIITQDPHGLAKAISYSTLTFSSLVLVFFAMALMNTIF